MAIRVALNHKTSYHYDRPVEIFPQVVRLRPAPHCRTPISSYSLKVEPARAFPQLAAGPVRQLPGPPRVSRQDRDEFEVEVDLVAEMTVINPFDFFLEPTRRKFPVHLRADALAEELRPLPGRRAGRVRSWQSFWPA